MYLFLLKHMQLAEIKEGNEDIMIEIFIKYKYKYIHFFLNTLSYLCENDFILPFIIDSYFLFGSSKVIFFYLFYHGGIFSYICIIKYF